MVKKTKKKATVGSPSNGTSRDRKHVLLTRCLFAGHSTIYHTHLNIFFKRKHQEVNEVAINIEKTKEKTRHFGVAVTRFILQLILSVN